MGRTTIGFADSPAPHSSPYSSGRDEQPAAPIGPAQWLEDDIEREASRLILDEKAIQEDGMILVRELPDGYRVGRAHIPPGPARL